ncbi:MAG: sugar MFS transporter [Pseudohongiellaceae bacterium]
MNTNHNTSSKRPETYSLSLATLTTLFFMWGFMTSLNDILIPHLRGAFALSYTQAMLIQFCFFGAYALVSVPAGWLLEKIGYQKGLVAGLMLAGVGCWIFYPAAALVSYPVFLGALFVLAAGITILQVSANPYVAALGSDATASSRLTMTQAFNSLGTTVAPLLGGLLILSVVAQGSDTPAAAASTVQMPYLCLGALFFILAVVFAKISLPKLKIESAENAIATRAVGISAWSFGQLRLGVVAIFVYVGAEVAIGSFLINYLGESTIGGLSEVEAAPYVGYYWGGAMVGRFIGALVMRKINAGRVLAFNAMLAVVLVTISLCSSGALAMWSILAVGLCNSIMFPTIFSLAVTGLGPSTSQGSGLLCMAIVGGALLPLLQGVIADTSGIQWGFVVPVLCYLYIVYYGLTGSKPSIAAHQQAPAATSATTSATTSFTSK